MNTSMPIRREENELSTMEYKKVLGEGAFKKVYSIKYSNSNGERGDNDYLSLALVMERLKSKSQESKNEIRDIQIAEHAQETLQDSYSRSYTPEDSRYFEFIDNWWI